MLAKRGTTAAKALRRSVPNRACPRSMSDHRHPGPRLPESIRRYVWQDLELRLERLVHTMIVARLSDRSVAHQHQVVVKDQTR